PSLGERLVQARVISQDNLQAALLVLAARDSHSLAPENYGDILMAWTLIQLGLISRERLNTWMAQEAARILQDLLTWSESEVSFVEGIQTPIDRHLLDHRVTSLISSLANNNSTSRFSREKSAPMIGKLSLPAVPVTPPLFEKAQSSIEETPDLRTSAPSLPALLHTPTLDMPKVSPPVSPFPASSKTSVEMF